MALDKTHLKVQFSRLVRKAYQGTELSDKETVKLERLAKQLNTILETPKPAKKRKSKRPKIAKSKSNTQSHWNGVNKV